MSNQLTRRGVTDVSGQWNFPSGPAQGTCQQHQLDSGTPDNRIKAFQFQTASIRGAFNTYFAPNARKVRVVPQIRPPDGLGCNGSFFDFPGLLQWLNSQPVTLSTRTLTRDRPFVLKFDGTATNRQGWGQSPDGTGTEHFSLSWSGQIAFRPTGCSENFFLSGTVKNRCYPG